MSFSFKIFRLSALIILVSSCSVLGKFNNKQFDFSKNDRQKKLLFKLPKGKSEEKFRVGDNDAKEQFYYFGDGSVFYIARHTTWQTVNKHRIDGLGKKDQQQSASYSGKDNNGLSWKEIHVEDFRIGYSYVPAYRTELFNEALNSVKIR